MATITPPAQPLGRQTARGAMWLMGQTLGSKVASILGNVALAWLLMPETWGLVPLAYSVWSLASLVQVAGIREVLIYRHSRFDRWANAAFWLSLSCGVLAGVITAAAAPLGAFIYGEPGIIGLVLVLATSAPLSALSVVPLARLQAELRFRTVALVQLWANVATVVLSIVFAAIGFEAYSFVLPRPIVALGQAAVLWYWARPRILANPQFRRWRFLAPSTGWLLGCAVCLALLSQGDYMVLGLFNDEYVVGIYFFAFNLSTQTMQLLGMGLLGTILPALSKLQNEPDRMREAFVRASRMVAVFAVPLCFLQAMLAGPLVRLIFPGRWEPAIPIIQLLSISMAFLSPTIAAQSMLQAQGLFRRLFFMMSSTTVAFVLATLAAGVFGRRHDPALWMAIAVMLHTSICWPINLLIAVRPVGGSWQDVAAVLVKPVLGGAIAIGLPWLLIEVVPSLKQHDLLATAVGTAIAGALYLLLIIRLSPNDWRDAVEQVRSLVGRRNPTPGAAPSC